MKSDRDSSIDTSGASDRMVLLVPSAAMPVDERLGMDMKEMLSALWRGRWLAVAITATFATLAIAYALLATQWYRAEVVLIPAEREQTLNAGSLAGLASLAGVNIGEDSHSAEAIAVLRSREFARAFIEEQNLMPLLFADEWDSQLGGWKSSNPDEQPDVRDGVKFFENNVLRVLENKKAGLVTVTVEWKDREAAARWANLLVERVNARMRERVLSETERNLKFLRAELAATNVVTLQQSISRLLEGELDKHMLARGNEEYAFRVVDRASVPKWRSRPKRTLLVVLATMAGGILAVMVILVRHALQRDPLPGGRHSGSSVASAP
jgi:uncharacterized protein involved in exopolysaccharide biosynthesis